MNFNLRRLNLRIHDIFARDISGSTCNHFECLLLPIRKIVLLFGVILSRRDDGKVWKIYRRTFAVVLIVFGILLMSLSFVSDSTSELLCSLPLVLGESAICYYFIFGIFCIYSCALIQITNSSSSGNFLSRMTNYWKITAINNASNTRNILNRQLIAIILWYGSYFFALFYMIGCYFLGRYFYVKNKRPIADHICNTLTTILALFSFGGFYSVFVYWVIICTNVGMRFKSIRDHFWLTEMSNNIELVLHHYEDRQRYLLKMMRDTNNYFRFIVSTTIIAFIPEQCLCVYILLFTKPHIFLQFMIFMVSLAMVGVIVIFGFYLSSLSNEAYRPYEIIYDLYLFSENEILERKVHNIMKSLSGQKICFTCGGIINITKNVMIKLISGVASHLIVLLPSNMPQKNTC